MDEKTLALSNALLVLVLDNRTHAHLALTDPMALKQASRALLDVLPANDLAPFLLERLRWDAAYQPGRPRIASARSV